MEYRIITPGDAFQLPLLDPQVARRQGFEGVVAKSYASLYRPNDRGWVKVKNPSYWRREAEREAMTCKHKRRASRRKSGGPQR